jgi:F-box/leucine-rich repeat protein 7
MRRHHGGRAVSPYAGRTAAPLSADVSLVRSFDSVVNPSRPARPSPLATSQIQGMPLDLIDRIRSFPLFETAPDSFLAEIGRCLKPQMNNINDYILTEGDDAKSMYWVVKGAVAVTSRDGESTYAELKSGAFFGEIGILMDRPRTATVIARTRCLLLVLKKEDLRKILPEYPDIENAIREEALERLAITEKKKEQSRNRLQKPETPARRGSKRTHAAASGDEMELSDTDMAVTSASKRRKSPSPGILEIASDSVLGHGLVNVRSLLRELPLFADLPADMLHFLGLNAQPRSFAPFTDIIKQGTTGREVYFIVRGECEVLDEHYQHSPAVRRSSQEKGIPIPAHVRARLKEGQYFGEVVSLSLADKRTATVRSISSVECLMISGEVLTQFWERSPCDIRRQIEDTAKRRLHANSPSDVTMSDTESAPDIDDLAIGDSLLNIPRRKSIAPRVTFNEAELSTNPNRVGNDDVEPLDPDPYSSVALDKVRSRSRRGSLAPISPEEIQDSQNNHTSPRSSPRGSPRSGTPSPKAEQRNGFTFSDPFAQKERPKPRIRASKGDNHGIFQDKILLTVFSYLELHDLMRLQAVSLHWSSLLSKAPTLLHRLDLSRYNRKLTDSVLVNRICPFVGSRPRFIDISNCFHITDEGFAALALQCGQNVTTWRMKSVWDVTAPAILEMSNRAKGLEEVDLSNCRKVSDTLLARIVGWVVPGLAPAQNHAHHANGHVKRPTLNTRISSTHRSSLSNPAQPPPGTVFGCPNLKSITLSYCKHITDRSMHHIASHAASRIESVDLTRCTTITDTGFQYWGNAQFGNLRKLCLADCTYLSDNAIISLTQAARGLRELDLVRSPLPLHCF